VRLSPFLVGHKERVGGRQPAPGHPAQEVGPSALHAQKPLQATVAPIGDDQIAWVHGRQVHRAQLPLGRVGGLQPGIQAQAVQHVEVHRSQPHDVAHRAGAAPVGGVHPAKVAPQCLAARQVEE
jgi:hypothetical protein